MKPTIRERLFARRRFGIKPGLDTVRRLLDRLGCPERTFAAIHVAGTNGKGSVCAMLAALFDGAGLPTGLFTSPHLVRLNERFFVGGEPLADDALDRLLATVEALALELERAGGPPPTFFECTTAVAFQAFAERGVRLAVVETGMGGRLDATNVLDPALAVITRIDIDHAEFLGDGIAAIAGEKAGIVKAGRPVVLGAMPEAARAVIRARARAVGAPAIDASAAVSVVRKSQDLFGQTLALESAERAYGRVRLPLIGDHQIENAATAVAAAEAFAGQIGLEPTPAWLRAGLEATRWPGRLQCVRRQPPLLLDGAHNPGGARALRRTIDQVRAGRPLGWVVGMCGDKAVNDWFGALRAQDDRMWTAPLSNERGMDPVALAAAAAALGIRATPAGLAEALTAAQAWAGQAGGLVVVAGSLFLVGDVLAHLGIDPWSEHRA